MCEEGSSISQLVPYPHLGAANKSETRGDVIKLDIDSSEVPCQSHKKCKYSSETPNEYLNLNKSNILPSDASFLKATRQMCVFCFNHLYNHLSRASPPPLPDLPDKYCPVFVTLEISQQRKQRNSQTDPLESELIPKFDPIHRDWSLRGCIGTLSSSQHLSKTLPKYALLSSLGDFRFPPITLAELPFLRCAVSLLVNYEDCTAYNDWTLGVHGIIIEFTVNEVKYSGTYLPDVANTMGWTVRKTVEELIKKVSAKRNKQPN